MGSRQVRREPDILLVAERDDLDCTPQGDTLFAQRRNGDDAENDAERSVEAPGIDHAVDMRADEDRGEAGIGALEAADDASRRVDFSRKTRLTHVAQGRLGGCPVGR